MSQQLQQLIKPWMFMDYDERLILIQKVRHNRFIVQPSKVKTAEKRSERKVVAKQSTKAKKALSSMSTAEKKKLLLAALREAQST